MNFRNLKMALIVFAAGTTGVLLGSRIADKTPKAVEPDKEQVKVEEEINSIYKLLQNQAESTYMVKMQQSVIMHYVVPHKKGEKIFGCPVCYGAGHKVEGMPGYTKGAEDLPPTELKIYVDSPKAK